MRIYNYGKDDLSSVFNRSQLDDKDIRRSVEEIVDNVRSGGDRALFEYCAKFDMYNANAANIVIDKADLKKYENELSDDLKNSILGAIANVTDYHKRQMGRYNDNIYDKDSSKLGWLFRPLARVGVYIPGGKASYPSSIVMCVIPAIVAGVTEVVIATPNPNAATLATASLCGVSKVYCMGGAHAISALAYGTESVGAVDLIAGPGNVYVTLAKKYVYGHVGIDMIAGPSEILIIADESAKPEYVAADLLSQAEHDEMAASILITTSGELALKVQECVVKQTLSLSRKAIIDKSLSSNGAIIVVGSIDDAVALSDRIAPEHLELCVVNADKVAKTICNAGAVFVGNYSPEPLGDYYAGPSHCLPTSGSARYFNVLSVDTFMKKLSYIEYSKENLMASGEDIIRIAEAEGLTAHANTIKIRMNDKE